MSKEYNIDAIDVNTKECDTCKKGLKKMQVGVIILSFYMFFAAIYGTIGIVKYLINLF
jgi:hypothetical protein